MSLSRTESFTCIPTDSRGHVGLSMGSFAWYIERHTNREREPGSLNIEQLRRMVEFLRINLTPITVQTLEEMLRTPTLLLESRKGLSLREIRHSRTVLYEGGTYHLRRQPSIFQTLSAMPEFKAWEPELPSLKKAKKLVKTLSAYIDLFPENWKNGKIPEKELGIVSVLVKKLEYSEFGQCGERLRSSVGF